MYRGHCARNKVKDKVLHHMIIIKNHIIEHYDKKLLKKTRYLFFIKYFFLNVFLIIACI